MRDEVLPLVTEEQVIKSVEVMMEVSIQSVIDNEIDEVNLLYCKPEMVDQFLINDLSAEKKGEGSSNGWQWDYFQQYTLDGKVYQFDYCGYYNPYSTFQQIY